MILDNIKKVYFIGIGGSSMSSLAEILKMRGYIVSGSDMQQGEAIKSLRNKNISLYIGHNAENVAKESPDIIIKTDAIADNNPELIYAKDNNIPVYRRAELLGAILNDYAYTIGVAGTHGKTTTTSMITSIFMAADEDPSALIGGHMKLIDASYRIGNNNKYCIFESCEFKESFLYFKSDISVILNIARDHMEYFKTLDNLIKSFRIYLDNTRDLGTVIANAEDKNSLKMLETYTGTVFTFGLEKGDFTAKDIKLDKGFPEFDVYFGGVLFGHIKLKVPGRHNVKNALAAITAGYIAGLDNESIIKGINQYNGAGRRFEYHCIINGAVVADDYGHHPDAYKVTFDTARDLGFKRIIAIHQPHTFSRTKMLMDEFVSVLKTVDKVLIPPIYPARETNDLYNVYSEDIVAKLPNAEYMKDFEQIADRIKELAEPGDLFITLGCGDIYKAAKLTTDKYGEKKY
ncbi:MAG: murC [Clostridia bacterium]|nr:murC [Clostridia bacterium]